MGLTEYRKNLDMLIGAVSGWESSFPEFSVDDTLRVDPEKLSRSCGELAERLKDNYPFHHPLYAGQMIRPPHPTAMIGYIAAMMINPNNHALDGGPATARMEKESVAEIARAFGFNDYLGHLTSSGTIANLEALFIARETSPGKAVAFSDQAHYTHSRACGWLGLEPVEIASDRHGGMDIDGLEDALAGGRVGTVVATMGTTGLGAVDDLEAVLGLRERYGFRLHADAAYGGYFALISGYRESLRPFAFLSKCDSVVVDPHKQGLQPYGCGCVIFSDPSVGRFYGHDSPYTYFTSDELHLGEISMECSRAGASAAALWLTMKLFELEEGRGMGPILKKTVDAAGRLAGLIRGSDRFGLYDEPQTNIVTFFPAAPGTGKISAMSEAVMKAGMESATAPLFLAVMKAGSGRFILNHPDVKADTDSVSILRSCLLKPEHLDWAGVIMKNLDVLYGLCGEER
ncbi:MAG: aminotransferase class I/II-fold pyridoxal phosphate-dependent enzyme [Spirochaetes bacterium]|jgi:glutamate/tyrosine decarboxylase-like PLP-dependent enzyme|nr:aminotransferase class I/II-fold pyridoxal phosphate-dependent enzyme [Spirochaetota bacterium]